MNKCKNCGGEIRSSNKSGYCSRTSECFNLAQNSRRHKSEVNPSPRTKIKLACKRCGVTFNPHEDQHPDYTWWCPRCRLFLTGEENGSRCVLQGSVANGVLDDTEYWLPRKNVVVCAWFIVPQKGGKNNEKHKTNSWWSAETGRLEVCKVRRRVDCPPVHLGGTDQVYQLL